MVLTDCEMDACSQYESWNKKAEQLPCLTSAGTEHIGQQTFFFFLTILRVSTNDHKGTTSIDLGIINKL